MSTVKLGEMLVSRGLISPQQLEQALAAQFQYGGRLGTNLVELGIIDDGRLAACLSEQLGVPYVRPQALSAVPRDVIALLPPKLAKKYRVVPLRSIGTELHVCMADPHNFGSLDELGFALSRRLRPYVVTEVTLNYALERYYNIPREPRITPAVTGWRDVGGPSSPTVGFIPATFGAVLPERNERPAPQAPPAAPAPSVVEQLAAAMLDDDVTAALFRYLTQVFDEVVLLTLVDRKPTPVKVGSRAGDRTPRTPMPFSLADATLMKTLLSKPQVMHQPSLSDPELRMFCASCGVPAVNVTLFSVFNGNQPFYAILGQGRDEAQLRQSFAGLKAIVTKTTQALRIVALRNEIRTV